MTHQTVVIEQGSWIPIVASAVGATAGLLALWSAGRRVFRNTLGRRLDRYARIARLGTGAQLSFFTSVLGEPPAKRRTITKADCVERLPSDDPRLDPALAADGINGRYVTKVFTESTFIDRDYYVQAICDVDETVLAFSVTTRSSRFKPRFQASPRLSRLERWRFHRRWGHQHRPLVNIVLGKTTFAELDRRDPNHIPRPHLIFSFGAHSHTYSEFTSFGRPGKYQFFVWTASDAARQGRVGNGLAVQNEIGGDEWPDPQKDRDAEPAWPDMRETQRFRRETVITTYTVISATLRPENYPVHRFGPHEEEVWNLP